MREFASQFQDIKSRIEDAKNILIISHQKPDGDALGSSLALSHYLDHLEKEHTCFCVHKVPQNFSFLPSADKFTDNHNDIRKNKYDLICVLDSGDLHYAGVEELLDALNEHKPIIINIDHHPTNTHFGHLNLVHDQASSASEIIFRFLDFHRHQISQETATCLLTGIMTDTGIFSNLATTSSSLEAASRLLGYGARLRQIMLNTMRNMTLVDLQLWGRVLSRLKEDAETGIVSTAVTREDFEEFGIKEEATEGIANFLNNLGTAKVVMVLKEYEKGKIKASLRTTHPDVDVSALAKTFGGGGHKKAAGFSVEGSLLEKENSWEVV
ncbi:bifunctional oligoribonuclease/PAP phosphatase NrnA [Patescibacteria group bacterium]